MTGSEPQSDEEADIRPLVGVARRDLSLIAIAITAAIGGILLFLLLNSHRRAAQGAPLVARMSDTTIAPPPPLRIPPPPTPQAPIQKLLVGPTPPLPAPPPPKPPVPSSYAPPPSFAPPMATYQQPSAPVTPRSVGGTDPALVVDMTVSDAPAAPTGNAAAGAGQAQLTRATVLRQRATTVVQGTLIPAVLESALNSSQPGLTRALVTRDIRGFDGSRVLIPRGSRLIGEYRSDVAAGQKRALVNWTRLIRPDGATIAIGSPASDSLGQGGIEGKVNSHFLARFGSAILQSILTIGTNVATSRIADTPIILGVPSNVGTGVSQPIGAGNVASPTITVRQGTAISIFAARDLDFTAVESQR